MGYGSHLEVEIEEPTKYQKQFSLSHMSQNAVATGGPSQDALVNVCVESWRFIKVYQRLLTKLDATEAQRYQGQVRYFQKQIEDNLARLDLRQVEFDGQSFDTGLPVTAINLADFAAEDRLVIEQTIEPAILGLHGLVRMGSVTVKRAA
ncbi:hypothetical protein [Ralstonia sp. SET104]|uniref:hypothetical protein n=1 Tax=Ralstonia sp. SET104 TaxID=2448774 RepID=UPI001C88FDD4|nr:hypothetical protein [Ralstonia sp. SET104]